MSRGGWARGARPGLRRLPILIALGLAVCTACSDGASHEQAIAVLIDVSGTYAEEKAEVARIVKREVLPSMDPGDTLILIRIDSESFDKENVEALQTLDRRPSRANAQKLALAQHLDVLSRDTSSSRFTDIRGAMMLGAAYLRETAAGSRVLLVFSDMHEELPEGTVRTFQPDELRGIDVVSMNVKPLAMDTADPEHFRTRLATWERDVQAAQASAWHTFMDPAKLGSHLTQLR